MKLTALERRFVEAVCRGEWFVPIEGGLEGFNQLSENERNAYLEIPADKDTHYPDDRAVRTEVIEKLLNGTLYLDGSPDPAICHENGLRAAGVRFDGQLFIESRNIDRAVAFVGCEFQEEFALIDCQLGEVELTSCRFNSTLAFNQSRIIGRMIISDCTLYSFFDGLGMHVRDHAWIRGLEVQRYMVLEHSRFDRDLFVADINCASFFSLFNSSIAGSLTIREFTGRKTEPAVERDKNALGGIAIQLAFIRVLKDIELGLLTLDGSLIMLRATVGGDASIYAIDISCDRFGALNLVDAVIGGDLEITGYTHTDGTIQTANLKGQLSLNRAKIAGDATFSSLQIESNSDTSVTMIHASIGGNLTFNSIARPQDGEWELFPTYLIGSIRGQGIHVGRVAGFFGCFIRGGEPGLTDYAIDFNNAQLSSFLSGIVGKVLNDQHTTPSEAVRDRLDSVFLGDSIVNCLIGGVNLAASNVENEVAFHASQITGDIQLTSIRAGNVAISGRVNNPESDVIIEKWREAPGQLNGTLNLNSGKIRHDLSIDSTIFKSRRALGESMAGGPAPDSRYDAFAINLDTLDIEGRLFVTNFPAPPEGTFSFEAVTTRYFVDDRSYVPSKGSPYKFVLDGFEYGAFADHGERAGEWSVGDRIRWLKSQRKMDLKGPGFKPQPWEQLYKVYKQSGHQNDARKIAIEKRDLAVESGRYGPISSRLYWVVAGLTCGYGYAPLRAMCLWILLVLGGAVFFAHAHDKGRMIPALERTLLYQAETGQLPEKYPDFQPLLYSIDAVLPFFELEQTDYWIPDGAPVAQLTSAGTDEGLTGEKVLRGLSIERIYYSIHGILGIMLMAAAALGFTGVLRREG